MFKFKIYIKSSIAVKPFIALLLTKNLFIFVKFNIYFYLDLNSYQFVYSIKNTLYLKLLS